MVRRVDARAVKEYLLQLERLPFVKRVRTRKSGVRNFDGILEIRTPAQLYTLPYEIKGTYLDQTIANAIIGLRKGLRNTYPHGLLLMAPYIPRPMGERFDAADINFIDLYGNLRLILGERYQALMLGKPRNVREPDLKRVGATRAQVLFVLLAEPDAINWPVRRLAEAAGTGKTVAAGIRKFLLENRVIEQRRPGQYEIIDRERLKDIWLKGYHNSLRPRITLGTFRTALRDPDLFVRDLFVYLRRRKANGALTGGPAAHILQGFYRGERTTVFVDAAPEELRIKLGLVPDRFGSVVLLRRFAPVVPWKTIKGVTVAHPWLIYADLLYEEEPRALEAAELIRNEYLTR